MASKVFANPNASHALGLQLNKNISQTRRDLAALLGAKPYQLFFNSGSTEGISSVFHSTLSPCSPHYDESRKRILISSIEHAALPNTAEAFKQYGYEVDFLPVTPQGVVDLATCQKWILEKNYALVSVMAANNETGVIQPYQKIAQLCQSQKTLFFSDTTQYIGKAPFHFADSGCDFAVLSGHKIGAMTGTGVLLCKDPTKFHPLILGGGQEFGKRGGTQHYLGIETLSIALQASETKQPLWKEVEQVRNEFEKNLQQQFPKLMIFGQSAPRMPSTTFLAYPGIRGNTIQQELERHEIYVTTSSACCDSKNSSSHVLQAMGVNEDLGQGAVRISLGTSHFKESYQELEKILIKTLKNLAAN